MKRDMDLIRKLLFYFEEKQDAAVVQPEAIHVEGYGASEISYHLRLMHQAGFLNSEVVASKTTPERVIKVKPFDLSWKGHEFLEAARDDGIWNRARDAVAQSAAGVPFEVLKALLIAYAREKLPLLGDS